jgi:hypothetical protein
LLSATYGTSRLGVSIAYRGFESTPLRHAVWTAEKVGCVLAKIARNGRDSSNVAFKPDRRKRPVYLRGQPFATFSLGGHWQSGFNNSIGRMECDYTSMRQRNRLDLLAFEVSAAKNVGNDDLLTL